jgi:pantoate kinase
MSHQIDPLALAGAKPKGKRPYFLKDPDVERVLNLTMAVAQELAVMRERLDTVERLLESKGITQDDIETFVPTPEQADQRGAWHQEYLARILRIYQQEIEALDKPDEPSSEDVGHELAKED